MLNIQYFMWTPDLSVLPELEREQVFFTILEIESFLGMGFLFADHLTKSMWGKAFAIANRSDEEGIVTNTIREQMQIREEVYSAFLPKIVDFTYTIYSNLDLIILNRSKSQYPNANTISQEFEYQFELEHHSIDTGWLSAGGSSIETLLTSTNHQVRYYGLLLRNRGCGSLLREANNV